MNKNTKPALRLGVMAVVILAVAVLAVITVIKLGQFRAASAKGQEGQGNTAVTEQTRQALEEGDVLTYKGTRYVRRRGLETCLILGVDRTEAQIASGMTNGQTDVLLLLVMDPRESRYRILQLNRDMVSLVDILSPDGSVSASLYKPLCLAHAYASTPEMGCENTVRSVRYLLQDTPIDGYAAMSLEAIGALCDAVGGVTVTIRSDLTAADPSFKEGATVTLDARTAEKFVRARMEVGESNNANRMERQMQFLRAWLETAKSKSAQDAQFAMGLLRRLEPQLTTNMTEKRLSGLAADAGKYENEGFLTIGGEYRTVDGFQYFYADEESLMDTLLELFYQAE